VRRRDFIAGLGSAAVWPVVARAQQQASMPVVGYLGPGSAAGDTSYLVGFRQGLGEAGFVESRNIVIEYRWANNQIDRLPALAAELAERPVAVIATGGATAAALAAKAATATIPIVFAIGADPVRFGLVASMNRPGGNVTGVSFLANALVSKQLGLLKELVPTAMVIGVLVNPNNPNTPSDTKDLQAAAAAPGLQIYIAQAGIEHEIDAAIGSIVGVRAAALLIFPDALFTASRARLASLAAESKIAAIYSVRLFAEAGGLLTYGANVQGAFRLGGTYVARILRGEKPGDLPVQQPTRFEMVINLKTAKALGLEIPPTILALADEVIE
jgi:putative tryptophan/tyrosine transport system substrate-binding protein